MRATHRDSHTVLATHTRHLVKILHLIAPGGVGGAETVVAAGVAALRASGADARVGIIDETRSPERAAAFRERLETQGVPHRSIPTSRRIDPMLARRLSRSLRVQDYDIVHAHGYKAVVYAATVAAPRALFATHHGEGGGGRLVGAYLRVARKAYRRYRRVFAVSDAMRRHLVERGVAPSTVVTLHNFVSLAPGPIAQPPEGPTQLVYIGRLSHEKGVDVLLQALAWSASEAVLTLVGDGPERSVLERRAHHLGLEDRVMFVGFQDDIQPWVREAHAAVLPSRTEGLPMTMLEVAALGRPVLATLVGGVPEVLEFCAGSAAVGAEDPAAFAGAIDGFEGERDERGAAARQGAAQVAERFSPKSWAHATLAAYRER